MINKKSVFIINGSASDKSVNQKLIDYITDLTNDIFDFKICNNLKTFPHFNPELSINNAPKIILEFRDNIINADGIIICTPEYIFSIPSGLKNAIEWCVSTTVFSDKAIGIITASANGIMGHEELQLIMKTVMAKFTKDTSLLIQGIKGKVNNQGEIIDLNTKIDLSKFIDAFKNMLT